MTFVLIVLCIVLGIIIIWFCLTNFILYVLYVFIIKIPGSHDYYLKVQANDGGTPSLSSHVIVAINVTDENDNVPTFNQKEYSAVIRENAQIGEEVSIVF